MSCRPCKNRWCRADRRAALRPTHTTTRTSEFRTTSRAPPSATSCSSRRHRRWPPSSTSSFRTRECRSTRCIRRIRRSRSRPRYNRFPDSTSLRCSRGRTSRRRGSSSGSAGISSPTRPGIGSLQRRGRHRTVDISRRLGRHPAHPRRPRPASPHRRHPPNQEMNPRRTRKTCRSSRRAGRRTRHSCTSARRGRSCLRNTSAPVRLRWAALRRDRLRCTPSKRAQRRRCSGVRRQHFARSTDLTETAATSERCGRLRSLACAKNQ